MQQNEKSKWREQDNWEKKGKMAVWVKTQVDRYLRMREKTQSIEVLQTAVLLKDLARCHLAMINLPRKVY